MRHLGTKRWSWHFTSTRYKHLQLVSRSLIMKMVLGCPGTVQIAILIELEMPTIQTLHSIASQYWFLTGLENDWLANFLTEIYLPIILLLYIQFQILQPPSYVLEIIKNMLIMTKHTLYLLFLQFIDFLLLVSRKITTIKIILEHLSFERRIHLLVEHFFHINIFEPWMRQNIRYLFESHIYIFL